MLKVGGTQEEWSPGHVDGRPTIHLLQTDLVKSVQAPFCLYKSHPTMKVDTQTIFWRFHWQSSYS
jgi:hypothetical protein